jgi:hypothetical protein
MASLWGFCKKHIPADSPPPPPHHPSDTNTNEPPPIIIPIIPLPALVSPAIDYSDISTNGWTDEQGNLFALYCEETLHCSTNNADWDVHIPLRVYLSFGTVAGMPNYNWPSNSIVVGPNFTNYSGGPIAHSDRVADQQYFRLSVP